MQERTTVVTRPMKSSSGVEAARAYVCMAVAERHRSLSRRARAEGEGDALSPTGRRRSRPPQLPPLATRHLSLPRSHRVDWPPAFHPPSGASLTANVHLRDELRRARRSRSDAGVASRRVREPAVSPSPAPNLWRGWAPCQGSATLRDDPRTTRRASTWTRVAPPAPFLRPLAASSTAAPDRAPDGRHGTADRVVARSDRSASDSPGRTPITRREPRSGGRTRFPGVEAIGLDRPRGAARPTHGCWRTRVSRAARTVQASGGTVAGSFLPLVLCHRRS